MFIIEEELKKLPAKPGVYIMRDDKDNIIYRVFDSCIKKKSLKALF